MAGQLRNLLLGMTAVTLCAACSGGGGGSSTTPNPGGGNSGGDESGGSSGSQNPPTVSEEIFADVDEVAIATVALDGEASEGGTLSYVLGGPDGDLFTVSSGGIVRSRQPLDFENPADADTDNTYELTYRVAESGTNLSDDGRLVIDVSNVAGEGLGKLEGTAPGDLWGASLTRVPNFGQMSASGGDRDFIGVGLVKYGASKAQGALVEPEALISEQGKTIDLNSISRLNGVTFVNGAADANTPRIVAQPTFNLLRDRTSTPVSDILSITYANPGSGSPVVISGIASDFYDIQTGDEDLDRNFVADRFESTLAAEETFTGQGSLTGDFNGDGLDEIAVRTANGYVIFPGGLVFQEGEEAFLDVRDAPPNARRLTVGSAPAAVIPDVFGDGADDFAVFIDGEGIFLVSGSAIMSAGAFSTEVQALDDEDFRVLQIEDLGSADFRIGTAADFTASDMPDLVFGLQDTANSGIFRRVYVIPGAGYGPSGNRSGTLADYNTLTLLPGTGAGFATSINVVRDIDGNGRDDLVLGTGGNAYVVRGNVFGEFTGLAQVEELPSDRWFQVQRSEPDGIGNLPFIIGDSAVSAPDLGPNGSRGLFLGVPIDRLDADSDTFADAFGAVYFLPGVVARAAFDYNEPIDLDTAGG